MTGLWFETGRVGVLRGFEGVFCEGVVGRAISSSNSRASSASASPSSIAGGQFSLSGMSMTASFKESMSGVIWTILVVTSPRTFEDPSFLGDGKSNRRVGPRAGLSSTSIGLCCEPHLAAGLDWIALLKAAEAAFDVKGCARLIGRSLPCRGRTSGAGPHCTPGSPDSSGDAPSHCGSSDVL